MWSVLQSVLRWCGVAVGAAVLRSVLRCCDVAVGVAVLRRYCGLCCGVVVRVAVSVAALRSVLQSVLRCCGVVVVSCDVAVKVGDAMFRSVVQSVQMS